MKTTDTDTKNKITGWAMLSIGALMISAAGGIAWGIPAALAIAGTWVIAYGVGFLIAPD
jgi:hypothetical protein